MLGKDFTVFAVKPGFVCLERFDVKKRNLSRPFEMKVISVVDVNPVGHPEQDIR